MNQDNIPTIGDNGELIATDYQFGDFGEVLDMVKKMPKLDLVLKNYNQYYDKRYYTGCSQMWAINTLSTIENYDFTREEIAQVYDTYESMGWKPGTAGARGAGGHSLSKRWNNKFPTNNFLYFVEDIFSEAVEIVLDKLGIIGVSIRVDGKYWKDVRDNLKADGKDYLASMGHATTMMKKDGRYICVDSVPRTYADKNAMIYEYGDLDKIRYFIKKNNLRADIHIIIMEKRLKQIDPKEKQRLEEMKKNIEVAIEANSNLRNLTTTEEEKQKRNEMNNYNRGKLKVINAMLGI